MMAEVDFNYEGYRTTIQCNSNDKMEDIFKKFFIKTNTNENSVIFLYGGTQIKKELTFDEINIDKESKKMTIIVNPINIEENKKLIKSKIIICPECGEGCKIKIEDYKITLYECKNKHNIKNIFIDKFENTQYIDESKIICEECKETNKQSAYKNNFFRCNKCKKNLCPLCNNKHEKSHNVINYEEKDYICEMHNKAFDSYCKDCKVNICMVCENENHNNHDIISFGKILPKIEILKKRKEDMKNSLEIFKKNIKGIIDKLNNVVEIFEKYYKINDDIINN